MPFHLILAGEPMAEVLGFAAATHESAGLDHFQRPEDPELHVPFVALSSSVE